MMDRRARWFAPASSWLLMLSTSEGVNPMFERNSRVCANPSSTPATFVIASAVAARLGIMGFLKLGMTVSWSALSPSSVVLPSTAIAMSATLRMASRLDSMQSSAATHTSSRDAAMASALLGLSCTMPSELRGTPVAPLKSFAYAAMLSM